MEHTLYVYEPECAWVCVRVLGVKVCVWTCDMLVCVGLEEGVVQSTVTGS